MPTLNIYLWRSKPDEGEEQAACTAIEKQNMVRGAGAIVAVLVAVLLAADAASAFFLCLASLALVDAAVGDVSGTGAAESQVHVWWLAPVYLVFLYVLTPWKGFPVGGLDAFAFAGSV